VSQRSALEHGGLQAETHVAATHVKPSLQEGTHAVGGGGLQLTADSSAVIVIDTAIHEESREVNGIARGYRTGGRDGDRSSIDATRPKVVVAFARHS
jgi:hypothetical protein